MSFLGLRVRADLFGSLLLAALFVCSPVPTLAQDGQQQSTGQEAESSEFAKPPRSIEITDVKDWQSVRGFSRSRDAKWVGYSVRPNEGDIEVIVKTVDGATVHSFKVGSSSGTPTFSHDSKWAAFTSRALEKEAEAATKAKRPVPSKIVLINLESGEKSEVESASSFAFDGEAAQWLAIRKQRSSAGSGGSEHSGTDLVLHSLADGKRMIFGNVSEYSFNRSGKHLAMLIDSQGKLGNGLHLLDMESQSLQVLESDTKKFKQLSWTREGDSLACLVEVDSDKHEEKLHHLIGYRDVGSAEAKRVFLDMSTDPGTEEHLTISPNRGPSWTESRDGILFGVHDSRPKPEEQEEANNDKAEEADLVIWHWADDRIQSRQQVQESSDKRFSYLCIHRVDDETTLQLATDEMRSVSVSRPHRFAIATDITKYELDGSLDGRLFRDVYVINLATGERRLALEKNRWSFGVSPTGDRMLYYVDGHFHVYDLASGESRNLTADVPTSFIDTENDRPVIDPPISPIGWSQDGASVLLSDNWDIWQISLAGGHAKNLTVNGKEEAIRYQRMYSFDPEKPGIDLSQAVYVSVYGEWTKKSGIGRIAAAETGVEMLLWDDASFQTLGKLKDSDDYFYVKATQQSSSNYYVAGPDLKDAQQVTEINPQQAHFKWSSGVRLVDYESTTGQKLQAALFLPADYIEGKAYPTVVYIYEKLSQRANSYDSPRVGGFSSSLYTSQGYAVLMPDIVYRTNDPGVCSVECVIPALDAAIATGVVDADNVGIHGHSWGGYQTSFLITQTQKFKAAVAGAPLTNLISMYSSIYWNSGNWNGGIFESSQGRFSGGYWTNLAAYARNSPVYHVRKIKTPVLLLHNDKDGAVDWNQGIEFYNTLRRLQKPIVMLQYKGENHGLANLANRKDYSYRMLHFFNHYLKGEEAPEWWTEGIDHLDMQDHIKNYRKENEAGEED